MEKTSRFKPIFTLGNYRSYGQAAFPDTLALSVADAALGLIGAGKPMCIDPADPDAMIYADGQFFYGFLNKPVGDTTNYAVGSCNAYVNNTRNSLPDGRNLTPEAPGRQVGITNLGIMSLIETEGIGDAGPDTFVATTGVGAIANTDAAGTQVGFANGSWIKLAVGGWCWGHIMASDLTPENDGEVRISIMLVSPYVVTA